MGVALAAVLAVVLVFTRHQQTTVPTGDYYAVAADQNGKITSRRATRPLQAELRLVSPEGISDHDPPVCESGLICPGPLVFQFSPAPPADGWLIEIASAVRWRFTTSSGQVMGEATYLSLVSAYRYLTYGATSGWRVDEITNQMIMGQNELGNQDCVAGGNILETLRQDRGFSYQVGTSIEGCILTINNGAASQEALLWRFGVLLAVDQAAPIPVGVVTAWAISQEEAAEAGLAWLLRKPFDLGDLVRAIQKEVHPRTSHQRQTRLVEQFFDALNSGDWKRLARLCTPNVIIRSLSAPSVAERGSANDLLMLRASFEQRFLALPGYTIEGVQVYNRPLGVSARYLACWQSSDGVGHRAAGALHFRFQGERIAQIEGAF